VFYTAEIGFGGEPLREFSDAVRISGLPEAQVFAEAVPGNWAAALRQLAGVLPDDGPSIVVLDELPYLMDPDGAFESVLQRSWDRELSRKPVLLVLVGSDLSMMEALTSYGRPFYQRGTQLRVGPLNPADVAAMAGLPAAEAFDAALVTGGLPIICARWRHGEDTRSFLARELAFLGPHLAEVDRMRSDLTMARIERSWSDWRGRAVEPLVREALARLLPAQGIPAVPVIGGYWTRSNDVEIDIVGADRAPVARQLLFLGSVKWLETGQFDEHDLVALQRHRDRVTADPVPLIAVSRSGVSTTHADAAFTPADLMQAWVTGSRGVPSQPQR